MTTIDIELTSAEIMMAAQAGIMRQVENIKNKSQAYYGAPTTSDWQLHIEGCLGEFALAKFLNVWWSGKGNKRGCDVGEYDVRTRSSHAYDLILHKNDPDDRIFWLVTGNNGNYKIHGWILGKNGKNEKYWSDPAKNRPAFFVPQKDLNDPMELKLNAT